MKSLESGLMEEGLLDFQCFAQFNREKKRVVNLKMSLSLKYVLMLLFNVDR